MRRQWFIGALLLSICLLFPGLATSAGQVEYRAVTMLDGTVHRGVVIASDATSLHLKTSRGEVTLPLLDIVKIEPLTRERFLTQEGRRVLFLGTIGEPALADKAKKVDRVLQEALQRDLLLIVAPKDLPAARFSRLNACTTPECRLEIARTEGIESIYGELERKSGQDRLRLRRFSRSGEQLNEVVLAPVGEPELEQERLARSAAAVLGETIVEPAPAVAQTTKTGPSSTAGPTGPTTATTGTPSGESPSASKTEPPKHEAAPTAEASGRPGVPATARTEPTAPGHTDAPATAKAEPAATVRTDAAPTARTQPPPAGRSDAAASSQPATTARTDKPASTGPASTPESAGRTPETVATPSKSSPSVPSAAASTTPAPTGSASTSAPAGPGSEPLDLRRARRLDLLPVPGASSLLYFHDPKNVVVSAGVVAVMTGMTVFFVGDTRRLGDGNGLPVPWTFEARQPRDAVLLTGVGAVTYVASTWVVNQVVRKVTLSRKRVRLQAQNSK